MSSTRSGRSRSSKTALRSDRFYPFSSASASSNTSPDRSSSASTGIFPFDCSNMIRRRRSTRSARSVTVTHAPPFFRSSGRKYVAEITDRTGHGGKNYVWWLDIRRPQPGFEVYSTRSTLPLRGAVPLKVDFCVLRKDGFDGSVEIEVPKTMRLAAKCVATAGVEKVSANIFYKGKRLAQPQPATITACATIGGRKVRVPVVPCDEYEQAFAWHHLVPAGEFILTGVPGSPPKRKNKK